MRGNSWTGVELDLLRKLWPTTPWNKLEAMFPRHPRGSITRMASAIKVKRRRTRRGPRFKIFRELRTAREAQNLTRPQLSEMVGYHWTLIGRWENGEAVPSLRRLLDWAEALGFELVLKPRSA